MSVEVVHASDRRRQYRVTPETSAHLRVVLVLKSGQALAARLLDVSASGAGIAVGGMNKDDFQKGQYLVMQFRSPRLKGPLSVVAQVMAMRFGNERPLVLGLAFRDWGKERVELDPIFLRLFNQRASFRVEPSGRDLETMRVILRPMQRVKRSLPARIADLSVGGMGLWARVQHLETKEPGHGEDLPTSYLRFGGGADLVGAGSRVEIGLTMPQERTEYRVPCMLRHLRYTPGQRHARFGVAFPTGAEMPRELHKTITEYVMERQRQLRQAEAESRYVETPEVVEPAGQPLQKTG